MGCNPSGKLVVSLSSFFSCHTRYHGCPGQQNWIRPIESPHMAGLVVGINIKPGPSDLISKGPPRELTLYT